jgi:mRNA interferase MazF
LTSEIHDFPLFRITIEPTRQNGLARRSQVMVDKAATVPRTRIGQRIGRLEADKMRAISVALARFLGFI